jgi:hypothetical protein
MQIWCSPFFLAILYILSGTHLKVRGKETIFAEKIQSFLLRDGISHWDLTLDSAESTPVAILYFIGN